MPVRWIDVSMPMTEGMPAWPGDPPFEAVPCERIASGASCNTTRLTLTTHTGTHIDAPWHFIEDGKRVEQVDESLFFGEARLMDVGEVDMVRAADLGAAPLPRRMLLRTRNSLDGAPCAGYAALAEDAARRLVNEGVRLVGVDGLSVGLADESGDAAHRILLGNDVLIVEGLRLGGVAAGPCRFIVLPLPLAGIDGAPCRAYARVGA